nr:MAG TPA: hypothetical protein [Caudoviricetes sp.]
MEFESMEKSITETSRVDFEETEMWIEMIMICLL